MLPRAAIEPERRPVRRCGPGPGEPLREAARMPHAGAEHLQKRRSYVCFFAVGRGPERKASAATPGLSRHDGGRRRASAAKSGPPRRTATTEWPQRSANLFREQRGPAGAGRPAAAGAQVTATEAGNDVQRAWSPTSLPACYATIAAPHERRFLCSSRSRNKALGARRKAHQAGSGPRCATILLFTNSFYLFN
jgi:hypothetical protein